MSSSGAGTELGAFDVDRASCHFSDDVSDLARSRQVVGLRHLGTGLTTLVDQTPSGAASSGGVLELKLATSRDREYV